MGSVLVLLYGAVAYVVFFGTILYAIGFVSGIAVPKTIDSGMAGAVGTSVLVNLAVLTVFALQHSVMARQSFKRWWTQFVPKSIERSTYVLLSSLALILVFWQWRPIPAVVWQVSDATLYGLLLAISLLGWGLVFASTFLINHFELFGLQQVFHNFMGRTAAAPRFRTPLLYRLVRHPLYLGFLIAFWVAPVMTVGHLLFAAVTTAYILVGIALEERDLVAHFGDEYRRYRQRVGMIIPFLRRSSASSSKSWPIDTQTRPARDPNP